MQYKRVPRYRISVPGRVSVYFGRKPSVMDYIKNNCLNTTVKVFEILGEDNNEFLTYMATLDEEGLPIKYSGIETGRKKE